MPSHQRGWLTSEITDVTVASPDNKEKVRYWFENEIFRFEGNRVVESWGEGGLDDALDEIGFAFRSLKADGRS